MADKKVVAIAGASSGSGKAMAEILAEQGYLAPAAIRTPWAEKAGIKLPEDIRFLEAEDVARVVQLLIETAEHVNVWNLDIISREQTIDAI